MGVFDRLYRGLVDFEEKAWRDYTRSMSDIHQAMAVVRSDKFVKLITKLESSLPPDQSMDVWVSRDTMSLEFEIDKKEEETVKRIMLSAGFITDPVFIRRPNLFWDAPPDWLESGLPRLVVTNFLDGTE